MSRLAFIFIAFLLPFITYAETVEIDGICYNLIPKGRAAEVTSGGLYTGNISIPDKFTYEGVEYNVTAIGKNAFSACSDLSSITIPNTITSIDECAFSGCTGLLSFTIPSTVTVISNGTFNGCRYLKSIIIPETIISIGDHAFSYCNSLNTITIPNSVISIGSYAFKNCKGLESFTMGNGVKSFGKEVFTGCNKLEAVHISDLAAWCKIAFVEDDSNPLSFAHHLYLNDEEIKNLIVPDDVTSIGYAAFRGCKGFTSATISDNVTSIGKFAFEDCINLVSVAIPQNVTIIKERTFCGCHNLSSVSIPENVTSIEYGAFWDCPSLTAITIPNKVASIGERAFAACSNIISLTLGSGLKKVYDGAFGSCPKLENVYSYALEAPIASVLAFNNSYIEYATLHVPSSALELYKTTAPWSNFGTIVALTDEESAIYSVLGENTTKIARYSLGGHLTNAQSKGVHVIKMSDGNIKKVLTK